MYNISIPDSNNNSYLEIGLNNHLFISKSKNNISNNYLQIKCKITKDEFFKNNMLPQLKSLKSA